MKKILAVLFVLFVLIQFFPIDQKNPEPTPGMDFLTIKNTPEKTANIIRSSCYDCHSNESTYPWYANVQPVGWFLKSHIDEGRKKLNFSTFATYEPKRQAHKLFEARELVENGEMPLDSYTLGHPEADLSESQRQELIKYFNFVESDIRLLNELPAEKSTQP